MRNELSQSYLGIPVLLTGTDCLCGSCSHGDVSHGI